MKASDKASDETTTPEPNPALPNSALQTPALKDLLANPGSGFFARWRMWLVLLVACLVVGGVAFWLLASGEDTTTPRFVTEPAARGTLTVKVSATGNLQPTNKVDVGSELSGIVTEVLVDENDQVEKGQVLARLDLSRLQDAVSRSKASLASADAQVLQAEATVAESRAALARFKQVSELSGGKVPSRTEMDGAEANVKRAAANEAIARAAVIQARANVKSDETNLSKASIRSPINGVVLTRTVEPGQTVAASLQAPVLFQLAEDLAKMELQVDVDEADVGQVKVGQKASFSVDAWPGRRYDAVITRVGFGSQVKEGVVSYRAVLEVSNTDLSLRPGMTGTAEITTITREDVLLVPNAALRFSPAAGGGAPPQSGGASLVGKLMPRPPRAAPRKARSGPPGAPKVWVLRDGVAVPTDVKPGSSNGKLTEVLDGALQPGDLVITEAMGGSGSR